MQYRSTLPIPSWLRVGTRFRCHSLAATAGLFAALLLALPAPSFGAESLAPPAADLTAPTVRLVVQLKPPSVFSSLATGGQSARAVSGALAVQDLIPQARIQRFVVPASKAAAAIDLLRRRPDVAFAERELPVYALEPVRQVATTTPNDPRYGEQWALPRINAPSAWAHAPGTTAVVVAVVDTGAQFDHPDLQSRLLPGADCTLPLSAPVCVGGAGQGSDGHGHGTHVAGIIAAAANNGTGIAGVAYESPVRIMPVKVLDDSGTGSDAGLAAGIYWALDSAPTPPRIINISLGGPGNPGISSVMRAAIDYAHQRGILVVAAAGNCGRADDLSTPLSASCSVQDMWTYPAAYAEEQPTRIIPVASTDQADARSSFSTQASYVAAGVAAPGSSILSTTTSSSFDRRSGTSMATAHVAGVAALIWSVYPSLTAAQVRDALRQSAVDLGSPGADSSYGAGRIDALAAMQRAAALAEAAVSSTATPSRTATAVSTSTATATASPTATASATRTVTSTATAMASGTASPTPTSTVMPTTTPASAPAPPVAADPPDATAPSTSGTRSGSTSTAPSSGRAPAAPSTGAAASRPSVAPVPAYAAQLRPDGVLQIAGSDGLLVLAPMANLDPATGRRRFNGWLRSDSGPIFGVDAVGRLQWISPDDTLDLLEIDWAKVRTIPDDALTSAPLAAPRPGWLLWDFRGSGRIFLVGDDGSLHHIPDLATFHARFEWKNVLPVSAGQVAQLQIGSPVPSVA